MGFGFYYSTVSNAYVKVCSGQVQKGKGTCEECDAWLTFWVGAGSKYTQEQYNNIVLAHLRFRQQEKKRKNKKGRKLNSE